MKNLYLKLKATYYRLLPYVITPKEKDIEFIVCSPGGAGTSMLIEFLSKYYKTNHPHNGDRLKHIVRPYLKRFKDVKVIYIIGNPIETTLSLLNRGFFKPHYSIHGQFKALPKGKLTLESIVNSDADYLNLNKLYANWLNPKFHHNKCLVIDFDHLWNNLDVLLDFCQLKDEKKNFPPKKERSSKINELPAEIRLSLERKYSRAIGLRENLIAKGGFVIFNK